MKKISLISPLRNEAELLKHGLIELESFIQKFPLQWELVLVIDPSEDETKLKANALKSEKIQVKVLENQRILGRGPSVLRGLKSSEGDFAMVFPLDFTSPLADLFLFVQEMLANPQMDLIIGNRNSSRKKRESPLKTKWHWVLENILSEKLRSIPFQDPLCPSFIIRRDALDQLLPRLKMKSWYYTPEILLLAHRLHFKISEIPILSRDKKGSQIPLFTEFLRNLF